MSVTTESSEKQNLLAAMHALTWKSIGVRSEEVKWDEGEIPPPPIFQPGLEKGPLSDLYTGHLIVLTVAGMAYELPVTPYQKYILHLFFDKAIDTAGEIEVGDHSYIIGQYQCGTCTESFNSEYDWRMHHAQVHKKCQSFSYELPSFEFENMEGRLSPKTEIEMSLITSNTLNGNNGSATNTDDHPDGDYWRWKNGNWVRSKYEIFPKPTEEDWKIFNSTPEWVKINWTSPNPISLPWLNDNYLRAINRVYHSDKWRLSQPPRVGPLPPPPQKLKPEAYPPPKHRTYATKKMKIVAKELVRTGTKRKPVEIKEEKKAERVEVKSQINGNNGEATNSDDVPHNQKPTLKERKAQSQRDKAQYKKQTKAPVKKTKKMGKSQKEVKTEITPTNFQETSTVQTYYRPWGKNGKHTCTTLGSIVANGPFHGGFYVEGGVNQSIKIDKAVFAGKAIGRDLDNYEQAMIQSGHIIMLPTVGSTQSGSYWLYCDADALDELPPNTVISPAVLESHKGAKKHTLWKDKLRIPIIFQKDWVWTDAACNEYSNTLTPTPPVTDPRLSSFGIVNLMNGDGLDTGVENMGTLFLEAKFKFRLPQVNDDSFFLASSKKVAKSGSALLPFLSTGVNVDAFQLPFGAVDSDTGSCEYAYNPRLMKVPGVGTSSVNAFLNLPVGSYLAYLRLSLASTDTSTVTAVTAGQNFTNCTYTAHTNAFKGTDKGVPEFCNQNDGDDVTRTQSIHVLSFFRISSITAGTYATTNLNFTPTITSGPSSVGSVHLYVTRLPDFAANPIKMFFPSGASNGFTLQNQYVRVVAWNRQQIDHPRFRCEIMECEKRYIQQVKDAFFSKFLKDEEKGCEFDVQTQIDGKYPPKLRIAGVEAECKVLEPDTPLTPELVENPMSRSLHLNPAAAASLIGGAQAITSFFKSQASSSK